MAMSLGDRFGIAGLIVAFFAVAAFYLWPDKKIIGWVSLAISVGLAVVWIYMETRNALQAAYLASPGWTTATVALAGGLLSAWLFSLVAPTIFKPPQNNGAFTGSLAQISFGNVPPKNDLVALLVMAISNAGTPAAIQGWRVAIKPLGVGDWVDLKLVQFHLPIDVPGPDGVVTYPPSDALMNKATAIIPTGGLCVGFLAVVIPEEINNRPNLEDQKTQWRITFSDTLQKTTIIPANSGVRTKPGFAPGTNFSFAPQTTPASLEGLVTNWVDNVGLKSERLPALEVSDSYFTRIVTMAGGRKIAVILPKDIQRFLVLQSRLVLSATHRKTFDRFSITQKANVTRQIQLELSRLGIGYLIEKPLQDITVDLKLPISGELTEAKFIDALNRVDAGVQVVDSTIGLLVAETKDKSRR